jgi:hypothetical protein
MLLAGIQANCGVAIRLRTKSEQADEKPILPSGLVLSDFRYADVENELGA